MAQYWNICSNIGPWSNIGTCSNIEPWSNIGACSNIDHGPILDHGPTLDHGPILEGVPGNRFCLFRIREIVTKRSSGRAT